MKKPNFRKILKYSLRALLCVVASIALYFLAAYSLSYWGTSVPKITEEQPFTGYLNDNGVHIDLVLPAAAIDTQLLAQWQPTTSAKYVAIGWGDRGFYLNTPTWDDLHWGTVFYALFWNSPAVMHLSFYPAASNHWVPIPLSQSQIDKMLARIQKSFQTNADGSLQLIEGRSYGKNDHFFEAKGDYNCFRTCNVWTGKILKTAGVKTAIWSPFTFGIMYHAKKNSKLATKIN